MRALLSAAQHQKLLSCQCLGAKLQENSKASQPHTEQLSITNTKARKYPGKSVCMLQNKQKGCVYPSHFRRFLPETRQETWSVNEVSEGVGLIVTKSVTHPLSHLRGQRRNKPGGWRTGSLRMTRISSASYRTASATEPGQSAVTCASGTITWMSLVCNKMWGIITLTT